MTTPMILGIDAGNKNVKMCGPFGVAHFSAALGEWKRRNIVTQYGFDDMEWEIAGRKGFGGTLAEFESEFSTTRKGESKAHVEAQIRVLLALHRYAAADSYQIVVGQPIGGYTDDEKRLIKHLLRGRHQTAVNGLVRCFEIAGVEVSPEGASVGLLSPQEGVKRVIEIGSGTVNFATLKGVYQEDGKLKMFRVNNGSWSLPRGMENSNVSGDELARGIINEALQKFRPQDRVEVAGGGAPRMFDVIASTFKNAKLVEPRVAFRNPHDPRLPLSAYANCVAFYDIARKVYHA